MAATKDQTKILDTISKMTVMEVVDLIKSLKLFPVQRTPLTRKIRNKGRLNK